MPGRYRRARRSSEAHGIDPRSIHDFQAKIEDKEAEKNKIVNRLSRGDELPHRRARNGQGLRRHQAQPVGGRQDGRPPRQQGCHLQDLRRSRTCRTSTTEPPSTSCSTRWVFPAAMNVGQILETHLGIAAKHLGVRCYTPAFDGARESEIEELLTEGWLADLR